MVTNYYSHYTYTDVSTDRFARPKIKKDFHKLEAFEPDTHICDMFECYSPSPVTHNMLIVDGLSQDILNRDVLIRPTVDGVLAKVALTTSNAVSMWTTQKIDEYILKKVNIFKPSYMNKYYSDKWVNLYPLTLQDYSENFIDWCNTTETLFDTITAIQPQNMRLDNFNNMIQTLVSALSPKGVLVLETVTDYTHNAFNKALMQTLWDITDSNYAMDALQRRIPALFSCGIGHKAIANALNEQRMKYYAIDTISMHVNRKEWLTMVNNTANEYIQHLVTYDNILENITGDNSVVGKLHKTFDKTKYEMTHMTDPAIEMISAKEHNFVYATMNH